MIMSTSRSRCLVVLVPFVLVACQSARSIAKNRLTPAEELLARAVQFHDPAGSWGRQDLSFSWVSKRPNREPVPYAIEMASNGDFAMRGQRAGMELEYRVVNGVVQAKVDGDSEYSAEVGGRMVLDREDGLFWRNYMGFLAGMPMNLPGERAMIETEVQQDELEGSSVLALRITYPPEVGTDIWTFYFDPETAAMRGCRFDRADPSRDGETIVFSGIERIGELRMPKERRWYMNADWRYLGMDEVMASRRP